MRREFPAGRLDEARQVGGVDANVDIVVPGNETAVAHSAQQRTAVEPVVNVVAVEQIAHFDKDVEHLELHFTQVAAGVADQVTIALCRCLSARRSVFGFALAEVALEQREVFFVSEFEIALVTVDEVDRLLGKVAHDDSAVVSGAKVRVGQCAAVGFGYDGIVESLRSLHPAQAAALGSARNVFAVGFDNGVDGREGRAYGLVLLQSLAYAVDDGLGHEGPYGVVDEQVDIAAGIGLEGRQAGVGTFLAAGKNVTHLFPGRLFHNLLHFPQEIGM